MKWFLDTNICIDYLRNTHPVVAAQLRKLDRELIRIPSMVQAELLHGAEKSAMKRTMEATTLFLSAFTITAFDSAAAERYGSIRTALERRGERIGFNDLIIAATVMAHDGILITNNYQEFKRVKGLQVENWVEL
ncbi:MAG: type II toxin-antitoxin system VapC family toxin [Coriobacteriales bacterium]|jgi:tRNA(fMet)-specific endonuclease VapC|nr:type II toxin-antitoxin system VapC family toxin [Coriobacteriales bacterium]